ncbi:putative ankyrin repeat protein RF_0381 [Artemia franciscana]
MTNICVKLFQEWKEKRKKVLHNAAANGNLDMCQRLISRGVSVNALNSEGTTAIYYAVISHELDVTRYLLENGANPNAKCGETILQKAALVGCLNICRLLVAKGACIDALNERNETALYYGVVSNSLDVTTYLLENGANTNLNKFNHKTLLHSAAEFASLKICQLLVTKGTTIDALDMWNRTPLYYSTVKEKFDVTKYLLENGANPNAEFESPYGDSMDMDFIYMDCQGKLSLKYREKILHVAARQGNLDIFKLLISKGADMNCLTSKDETPLMIALEYSLLSRNHLQNYLFITEYILKNMPVYNAKLKRNVKDKYKKIFKQAVASKHVLKKLEPWLRKMCKLASEKSDDSLKSLCQDVIWKNIDITKISDIINGLNIPECLRRYIIYAEELRYFVEVTIY